MLRKILIIAFVSTIISSCANDDEVIRGEDIKNDFKSKIPGYPQMPGYWDNSDNVFGKSNKIRVYL